MAALPPRPDISDNLVHFTRGAVPDDAARILSRIVEERRLIGSNQNIRGGYNCVCFTEAPLTSLNRGLVNPSAYSRYSPFGIIVQKSWLFEQGGRPVIYQSDDEYDSLREEVRWRHVRYEPGVVDFTWEREWRIRCDELRINPAVAGIIVPDDDWAETIIDAHEAEDDFRVQQYAQLIDEEIAQQYRQRFPWRVYALR